MSSRKPFGMNREATNKVNIVKLENRLAYQFRNDFFSMKVPIYNPSEYGPPPVVVPITSIANKSLTSRYFIDKTLDGKFLAKDIAFPSGTILVTDGNGRFDNQPATIQHVREYVMGGFQELNYGESIDQLLTTFSDTIAELPAELVPLDASIFLIDVPDWVVETRIADETIVGENLDTDIVIPTDTVLSETNHSVGQFVATTAYVIGARALIDDASLSIGDIAAAITNMTDASFRSFADGTTGILEFDGSHNLALFQIRENSAEWTQLHSLDQTGELLQIRQYTDASLAVLYVRDGSLSYIMAGNMVGPPIEAYSGRLSRYDASFSTLKSRLDSSFSHISSAGWVNSSRFSSGGLTLSSMTTLGGGPSDPSSHQVATNSYVKTELGKLANSSVMNSYAAFASAIGGDASFAYSVIKKSNNLDASCVEFNNRIDSLVMDGSNALNRERIEVDDNERWKRIQDGSVNTFSVADFTGKTDACLNSLAVSMKNSEIGLVSLREHVDSSLVGLYGRNTSAAMTTESIRVKHDTSYSLLDTRNQQQNERLLLVDNSLNIFLNMRENSVETRIFNGYSVETDRFMKNDASLSHISSMADSSFQRITGRFNVSDNSLVGLEIGFGDLSNNVIPQFTSLVDNSLVMLRETYTLLDNSIVGVRTLIDTSLNSLVISEKGLREKFHGMDSSLSAYTTTKYETIHSGLTTSSQSATTNMNATATLLGTRDDKWNQTLETVDGSFSIYALQYNNLYRDASISIGRLRVLDTSMTSVYRNQTGLLYSLDNTIQVNSSNIIERMRIVDNSLVLADSSINIHSYILIDNSVGNNERKTGEHDSSFSQLIAASWVDSSRLANLLVLPSGTTCIVVGDPSGAQIATTGYLRRLVDETVGTHVAPFSHLNSLAFALNNTGNYSILVDGYLTELNSQIGFFNSVLGTLTNNTGGDFNYDASLTALDNKLGWLETSANTIDSIVETWKSTVDTSLGLIYSHNSGTDNSLNSFLGRYRTIEEIRIRQGGENQAILASAGRFDSSMGEIGLRYGGAKTAVNLLLGDISSARGVVGDISGRFTSRYRVSDASRILLIGKYGAIVGKDASMAGVDASFGVYSTKISTVNSGIREYLESSVDGAEYTSSFSILRGRLDVRDGSLVSLERRFDSSFQSVDTGNTTRKQNVSGLAGGLTMAESSRVGVVTKNNAVSADITTIGGAGWVGTQRLADASSLVLPSGVRISTVGVAGDVMSASGVRMVLAGLVSNAPVALNTLGEISAALSGDASLSSTLQSRLQSTDASLGALWQDGRIASMDADYKGRLDSVNLLPYTSLENRTTGLYERLATNDSSTNSAGGILATVNTKTEGAIRRLGMNDGSTNTLDGRFLRVESAIAVVDSSLGLSEQRASAIDTSFVSMRNLANGMDGRILVNDASTNTFAASTRVVVREASANSLIALLGSPTNIAVSGTAANSITVGYTEPVLAAAMGVSIYRATATPTYGTTNVVTTTAPVGTSSISVTGLVSGAVYDLSLAATNQYGVVVVSGVSSPTVLAPPTGLAGSASTTTSFTATWVSGGGVFTKYAFRLENGGVNVSSGDLSNNVVSRNFTGLIDGTPYLVSVRSANPLVQSVDVSMIFGTIFVAPNTPTFVSRTETDLSFSVTGTTKPYVRYNISYRPLGGADASATDLSSNFRLSGLTTGKIYDVSVNIQNAYGTSVWSPVVRNSTNLIPLPTLSTTGIKSSNITVNFSGALPTQDCSYVLRTDPNVNQFVLAAGAISQQLTGLTASTPYNIYLDASNAYTSTSATTSATTAAPPPLLSGFVDLYSSLEMHYRFDVGDFSSNNIHIFNHAHSRLIYDASKIGATLSFGGITTNRKKFGTGAYDLSKNIPSVYSAIRLPNTTLRTNTNASTVSFWINYENIGNLVSFINCFGVNSNFSIADSYSFLKSQGSSYGSNAFFIKNTNNANQIGTSYTMTANTWYHIVWIFGKAGTNAEKVYVNGALKEQFTGNNPKALDYFVNVLGRSNNETVEGYFDDYRFYSNRTLTEAEITYLYEMGNSAASFTTVSVTNSGGNAYIEWTGTGISYVGVSQANSGTAYKLTTSGESVPITTGNKVFVVPYDNTDKAGMASRIFIV